MWVRSALRAWMAASVNCSQPSLACEAGWRALTVKTLLSMRTPCLAQRDKSPEGSGSILRSLWISLKMFLSEGGRATPSLTAKDSPLA